MEPFIVSARKYRPETFEDVVGQSAITKTLENAIASNHLAQALLFTGPRGVGKTTCARILAKKINQQNAEVDPDEDFAFNIFELDAASNNSVDDIRSLTEQVRIPPQVGNFKVYIIDEVHMLSTAAFNAFLKTLEEPPAHAIFILATTEKHKIIPTILSRCQIFDFKRITVADMRGHLKRIAGIEGITADDEALHIIAQKADGALRDSLSIFDRVVSFSGKDLTVQAVTENLNVLDRETYFNISDLIITGNIPQLLVDYDVIMSKGFDGQHFIAGLASHFRDLMVCKDERTLHLLDVSDSVKVKYAEQSRKVDLVFLREAINLSNEADFKYRSSRNPRLHIELCLMQLASILTDGEKKNDVNYIIPASNFKNQPVAAEATSSYQTPQHAVNKTDAAPPVAQTNQPVEVKELNKSDSDNHNQAVDVLKDKKEINTPIGSSIVSNQTSRLDKVPVQPNSNKSIEEARKALLDRNKNKVSGLSIQAINAKKAHVVKNNQDQVDTDALPEEEFTELQAQESWSSYAAHLRERGQLILASIMEADTPKLNGNHLVLRYPNLSMKEDLEKAQGQVLEHIKASLKNYTIELEIHVDKAVQKKYAYTDHEKFLKLVEKNPAIDLLRRNFDLEF
ncbi:DNA polymerase III subunit gamma/tau [Nonlabens mediterrranea]|uniref:DNA polymerase III subunit gamma/tau n=1 Tax=Nonlabens mediterrranea TaxID=1419947 RepID=A0ABS0A2H2_9FLAO|nr:DNA polymerase III subunit gamma/tau [Nonlabens mediterrranea]